MRDDLSEDRGRGNVEPSQREVEARVRADDGAQIGEAGCRIGTVGKESVEDEDGHVHSVGGVVVMVRTVFAQAFEDGQDAQVEGSCVSGSSSRSERRSGECSGSLSF